MQMVASDIICFNMYVLTWRGEKSIFPGFVKGRDVESGSKSWIAVAQVFSLICWPPEQVYFVLYVVS